MTTKIRSYECFWRVGHGSQLRSSHVMHIRYLLPFMSTLAFFSMQYVISRFTLLVSIGYR